MTNGPAGDGKIKWQTPVLIEDSISDSTAHDYTPAVDNYEGSNPAEYGAT